jgi:hypothetical protein
LPSQEVREAPKQNKSTGTNDRRTSFRESDVNKNTCGNGHYHPSPAIEEEISDPAGKDRKEAHVEPRNSQKVKSGCLEKSQRKLRINSLSNSEENCGSNLPVSPGEHFL